MEWTCGHCGNNVAGSQGYQAGSPIGTYRVLPCPGCSKASFWDGDRMHPGPPYGAEIPGLPDDIKALYAEARSCIQASATTAAILICRKILMHIANEKHAPDGTFQEAVQYLASKHYIPTGGERWVDHIRTKGNEANHEIVIASDDDARKLVLFTEMLLMNVYKYPNMVPDGEAAEDSAEE